MGVRLPSFLEIHTFIQGIKGSCFFLLWALCVSGCSLGEKGQSCRTFSMLMTLCCFAVFSVSAAASQGKSLREVVHGQEL